MRFALAFFLVAAVASAQHPSIRVGQRLFARKCSACHGDNAKGGRAPDLTTGEFKHGDADADLARNITKGIAGTQMPAIPMPEPDALAIVAWLRSVSGPAAKLTGDAGVGRDLFFGAAGCSDCHMFAGRGGRRGPDLSRLTGRKQPGDIAKALATPLERVTVGSVSGFARNEDTFTIHVMDEAEKWHFLTRAGAKIERRETPHGAASGSHVDDIVAFLFETDADKEPAPEWKPASGFNVTYERLRNGAREPANWLTYWGSYNGAHYSGLHQVTPANVARLAARWTYQFGGDRNETTPLVVDGLMFVTGPLNNAAALDARTGKPVWKYARRLPDVASHCTVMTNRGFAILGDRLYMATLDMQLVALDAKTGNVIWESEVDDYRKGFSITHAPLAIDGKIIVGVTSGECALTGFVDAFDAATGKKLWRTHTIAQPGDVNRKSWEPETSANYGGSPTWTTGTFDAETNTIFWATGNPGPDYDGRVRQGDNLYSCSVLALDAATGRIKWWFQYTPHDVHDWDGNETPVLIEGVVRGRKRKLLVSAQRNAFYYVLDRETGEFLAGRAFARQTWAKGLDDKGRPIVLPNTTPTEEGNYVCPDAAGAANWGAPSYDPATGFLLVSVREACATYFAVTKSPVPGEGYTGGGQEIDAKIGTPGAVRALDALTGATKWNYPLHTGSASTGVLATAGGVAFASSADGNLIALDSATGKYLWHYNTGASIASAPISYAVDGKQYVAISAQGALIAFALP
ncbi:MAG: PQQ-dependent dehydrogenase, methanol/ethanol family [Bryobacteraceae bacterium]